MPLAISSKRRSRGGPRWAAAPRATTRGRVISYAVAMRRCRPETAWVIESVDTPPRVTVVATLGPGDDAEQEPGERYRAAGSGARLAEGGEREVQKEFAGAGVLEHRSR